MSTATRRKAAPVGLAWRIAWGLFLAVVGLCAIGLELDREVRRRPELAPLVPRPFRHFAQERITAQAFAADEKAQELAEARRLVAVRPVPAEHLSALAAAAARNHMPGLSIRAIVLAGGRGWRDVLAQRSLAKGAIGSGEWEAAFLRVAALWSVEERGLETIDWLRRISAEARGRAEIARWLHDSSRWRDTYIVWGAENLAPDMHAETILRAIRAGTVFSCPALRRASRHLLMRGAPGPSGAIWAGSCAHGSERQPADFAFAPRGQGKHSGPFGWDATRVSSFSMRRDGMHKEWVLSYDNPQPGILVIAGRYAGLPPGAHRLTVAEDRAKGGTGLPLQLRMACIGRDGKRTSRARMRIGQAPAIVEIPGSDCAAQFFELLAPRGSGSISDLRLVPAIPEPGHPLST